MARWQGFADDATCPNGSPYCEGEAAMRDGQLPCRECFADASDELFRTFKFKRGIR